MSATEPADAAPAPAAPSNSTAQQQGQDDEALSSLLLLLRSNQTKDQPESSTAEAGEEPRGKPKDSFRNANIKQYTIEELRRYFHLPIVEVAKQLGICTTLLKKVCRKLKIKKWPYRQIRSITKSVQSLEMASLNDALLEAERTRYREQITLLQNTLDLLIQDPNTPVIGQGTLDGWQGMNEMGGAGGGADGGGDGSTNSLMQHKPKTDVAAVLAAAAATANFETSESTNKRRKQAAEELKQQEEEIAAAAASSAPMMIGATVTGHAVVTQNGKQRVKFVPPIYLAPLERRKMRSQKKLVPLIEPDICNYIHIDFLPRTLLRLDGDKLDVTLQEVQHRMVEQHPANSQSHPATVSHADTHRLAENSVVQESTSVHAQAYESSVGGY